MLSPPPLALYVHMPWCVRKCPYCDFNSHALRGEPPYSDYIDALIRDLDFDLPLVWGRTIHSVFFGGGTPSLFAPEHIDRFLQAASARLRFVPDCEITLETNPGTVEHGPFADYRRAGVNRLSMGVQSFDDGCLQRLGRIHSAQNAIGAVGSAQDAGIGNINLDLMFALPGQTLAMAVADVEQALALQPTHLSHYHLTLEPNTLFAARPPPQLPDHDAAWDMQGACQQRLAEAGFDHYEISAYARPDRQCRHNLHYWQFGDYLGIGAGAHGKLTSGATHTIRRRWKLRHPAAYMTSAGSAQALGGDDLLEPEQRSFDFMLNALRLHAGVPTALFEQRTGLPRSSLRIPLDKAVQRGWMESDPELLRATPFGQRFLNDLLELFLN